METAPGSFGNYEKQASDDIETKESEPKIHTVYAYIQAGGRIKTYDGMLDKVVALYTNQEELMALAHQLDNMFASEKEVFVPLQVYEREEDLPEEIRKEIRSENGSYMPMEAVTKEEGVVYAVLPNTDSTEGNGHPFIWVLVTDPMLANKIAVGNGPSGSNAKVISIPLNKFPISLRTDPVIRRGAHGELIDEHSA